MNESHGINASAPECSTLAYFDAVNTFSGPTGSDGATRIDEPVLNRSTKEERSGEVVSS